jgi:hypothetical protein
LSAITVPVASMSVVRASCSGERPRTVSLATTSIMSLENSPL